MLNAYDLYKKMKDDEIILAFEGVVTDELLSSVFSIMESKFDGNQVDLRIKKKINNILVECLQNVIHHAKHFKEAEDNSSATAIIIICKGHNNIYRINFLVFDRPPEALHVDIVVNSSPAVHADLNAFLL